MSATRLLEQQKMAWAGQQPPPPPSLTALHFNLHLSPGSRLTCTLTFTVHSPVTSSSNSHLSPSPSSSPPPLHSIMSAAELEQFSYQLSEVQAALIKDPENQELLSLKGELEDLVSLLTASLPPTQQPTTTSSSSSSSKPKSATPSTSTPSSSTAATTSTTSSSTTPAAVAFKAGDPCSCRYSDGRWYPARITQISGSTTDPVYTVVFKGFDVPETVTSQQIRAASKWDNGADASRAAGAAGEKRKADAGGARLGDDEKERKRKKNEKG
jgi:survival-of-motor-neuron-related-splicing factor 30